MRRRSVLFGRDSNLYYAENKLVVLIFNRKLYVSHNIGTLRGLFQGFAKSDSLRNLIFAQKLLLWIQMTKP